MPVGTQGTVKTVRCSDLLDCGFDMVLANTYHLYLRPGGEIVESLGGLHSFMGWPKAILTDSGGFQIWSLARLRKSTDEGYSFQSHVDGSSHLLTPEKVVELQRGFGSDIAMVLDECLDQPSTREQTERSLDRTLGWAKRSLSVEPAPGQALFGIVQGGTFPDLRKRAAMELRVMGFDGYAIGGLSVGEERERTISAVASSIEALPEDRPRYLMGLGRPEDLVDYVSMGVDMFDCVVPTRNARGGSFFLPGGHVNITNARFASDPRPVQEDCDCYACRNHSRAYLRHLFISKEWLGPILATLHNLRHYARLMGSIRSAIEQDAYGAFRDRWYEARERFDPESC
jgi:queuine tRNA-ribosyltransferase